LGTISHWILHQEVGILLVRWLDEHSLLPQIGRQVAVRVGYGVVRCHSKVTERCRLPARSRVTVVYASHVQKLLGHWSADNTCTSGSRNQSYQDRATFAGDLARYGVRLADLVAPVTAPNGHNRELSEHDGTPDGRRNFLGALDAETDVSVKVADGYEGLETSALSGTGLLLDRHDLEDLILQSGTQEVVNDLALLDWQRER